MKRASIIFVVVAVVCLVAPGAFAQAFRDRGNSSDHLEAGVFAELYRLNQADTNMGGVGARLSFNVAPVLQLEAEMSYDFEAVFLERFPDFTFTRTSARRIDGLFGPKLQTNRGPVRFFVTAKGGGTSFGFNPHGVTFGTFSDTVGNLRTRDVIGEFYPGGGVEAFFGPIGLRLDVGDEILFANGARNNLRVTFGPTIRF